MSSILVLSLRAVAAYFTLLILARFMGRKMISQMTFFDFVVGVMVGTVAVNVALGTNPTPLRAAAVLAVFALLTVAVDLTHLKSFVFTKIVNSEPVVLIAQGQLNYKNMRRVRLSITELTMLLREKNIFNAGDVDYAVFEIDGKLSVLPKAERKPVTPADMGFTPTYRGMDRELVIDGRIMEENLAASSWTKEKLLSQLRGQGVEDVRDVLYASVDAANTLHVSLKQYGQEVPGQHGIE